MGLKPVQKAILTLIKIKYFGIMHRYRSYIFSFHCHVETYKLSLHSYHLSGYQKIKWQHARERSITATWTHACSVMPC